MLAAAAYIEGAAEYDIEYVEGGSKSYPEGENEILYFLQTEKKGVWILPTYHPSALLRDESKKPEAWEDMKSLKRKLMELGLYPDIYGTGETEGNV